MFSVTIFKNTYDNKTDTRVDFSSFEKVEKVLYALSNMEGYKPKAKERFVKSSPLISPAIYKDSTTRANANVIAWAGWAAIDVDNHEFKGNLKDELYNRFGNWYYVCYSTASSTNTHPKFRMVFPLTEHVQHSEIKHFWYALNTEFGNLGDTQTKDLSRMYYVPAQYPGANNFIFTNIGNHVNPSDLLAKHPWSTPITSANFIDKFDENMQKKIIEHRKNRLNESSIDTSWSSYKNCPYVNKSLINEYKNIAHLDGSGRYSMIYKIMTSIACNAVKGNYPISESEIVSLVLELDRETSNRYQKRPLATEASRAIEFAYKNVFVYK